MKTLYRIWKWHEGDTAHRKGWNNTGVEEYSLKNAQYTADRLANTLGNAYIVTVENDNPNDWQISAELETHKDACSFADCHKEAIHYTGPHSPDICWDQTNGGYKVEYLTYEDFHRRF